MLLLVIPTRHEAADITRRLSPAPGTRDLPSGSLHRGTIGGRDVALLVCGMGPAATRRTLGAALATLPETEAVVLAGYAGGLDPDLQVGDLLVKRRGPALAPGDYREIPAILDASEVLADTAAKAAAFRRTGAPIVDMETSAVEAVLAVRPEIPFYVIRVVSDAAEHRLPADTLAQGYDMATSRETPVKMALHLIRHPGEIGALLTFLKRLPPARRRLSEFLLDRLPAIGRPTTTP